jgi:GTP cyclohydrolase I
VKPLAVAAAVRAFLRATGADAVAETAGTPERVAKLWQESLLDGTDADVSKFIHKLMPTRSRDFAVITNVETHAVCPHHLLPFEVQAHIGFVPNGHTAGFSSVARYAEIACHRLTLLEDLVAEMADGLMQRLGASGVACRLVSRQGCMVYRREKHTHARVVASAYRGVCDSAKYRREFATLIAAS